MGRTHNDTDSPPIHNHTTTTTTTALATRSISFSRSKNHHRATATATTTTPVPTRLSHPLIGVTHDRHFLRSSTISATTSDDSEPATVDAYSYRKAANPLVTATPGVADAAICTEHDFTETFPHDDECDDDGGDGGGERLARRSSLLVRCTSALTSVKRASNRIISNMRPSDFATTSATSHSHSHSHSHSYVHSPTSSLDGFSAAPETVAVESAWTVVTPDSGAGVRRALSVAEASWDVSHRHTTTATNDITAADYTTTTTAGVPPILPSGEPIGELVLRDMFGRHVRACPRLTDVSLADCNRTRSRIRRLATDSNSVSDSVSDSDCDSDAALVQPHAVVGARTRARALTMRVPRRAKSMRVTDWRTKTQSSHEGRLKTRASRIAFVGRRGDDHRGDDDVDTGTETELSDDVTSPVKPRMSMKESGNTCAKQQSRRQRQRGGVRAPARLLAAFVGVRAILFGHLIGDASGSSSGGWYGERRRDADDARSVDLDSLSLSPYDSNGCADGAYWRAGRPPVAVVDDHESDAGTALEGLEGSDTPCLLGESYVTVVTLPGEVASGFETGDFEVEEVDDDDDDDQGMDASCRRRLTDESVGIVSCESGPLPAWIDDAVWEVESEKDVTSF